MRVERAPAAGRPRSSDGAEPAAQRELPHDLTRLADLMDSAFRLPGGFRIGLDGLIGLVPGIGDAIGAGVSLYIVARAHKLGVSRSTLARMLLNIAAETLIGTVPLAGDLFDFVFKANQRNLALLRRKLAPAPPRGRAA